ncbi:MAG: hypothetical protein H6608_04535 [Flavobacteriales bacterium]|nr:hypothetical protein [Bacteroidota bacterium]MCB9240370.1 hypothetical protein [Flavobacteriales bacterium]
MNGPLLPLNEVPEDFNFQIGMRLRVYHIGRAVNTEDDFYEYLITYLPWQSDAAILVNVTPGSAKAGFTYTGSVAIDRSNGGVKITKSAFRHTLGSELLHWFLVIEE